MNEISAINCTDIACAGENMLRLTRRNYYGKAFVPGYAPRCADAATCELLVKITERLAELEDIIEKKGKLT